jgi:uncharacterized repeat protein (TIGR01451 family)
MRGNAAHRLIGSCAPIITGALLLSMPTHAAELRFSQTTAGQVVATGNTLGLSKAFGANGPGLEDSIGTFITLDAGSVDAVPAPPPGNPWPPGTTNDWTANGSAATLTLPPYAQVLYAELVWGGSTLYGSENVTAALDDAVTLGFGADTTLVEPDPTTALDIAEIAFTGFAANYYMRSAEVTAFVMAHGTGTYTVEGVPATQTTEINSLNAAGWTLLVAYRDPTQPIRNLTIFVGGSFVDEDSTEDYDFAGFCTPPSGPFSGRAVISTIEGDADLTGDSFQIGESVAGPFVPLAGPNNPVSNFFCSQLNDPDGQLDMSGTFGTVNQNAAGGFNVVGGRQGWDVASVTLESTAGHLDNGQTAAVLRAVTTGDSFVPTAVGFAIAINAPSFTNVGNTASAAPLVLALGESTTVTVDMHNGGLADATSVTFRAALPAGLELASFSIDGNAGDVGGNPVSTAALGAGVPVGTIAASQTRQLVFEVTAVAAPAGDAWTFVPQWEYDYVSCAGEPPLSEPYNLAPIHIDFDPSGSSSAGLDDTAGEGSGEGSASGGASASDSGSGTDDDAATGPVVLTGTASAGTSEDPSGCGCRSTRPAPGVLLPLLLVPLALRRRRR